MQHVHIVMDTFNKSIVIVTTSLRAAHIVAETDSSFVVVQNQPVIDHSRLAYEG